MHYESRFVNMKRSFVDDESPKSDTLVEVEACKQRRAIRAATAFTLVDSCRQRNFEAVSTLLADSNVDKNAFEPCGQFNPLLRATVDRNTDLMRLLINSGGIDVNLTGNDGLPALFFAGLSVSCFYERPWRMPIFPPTNWAEPLAYLVNEAKVDINLTTLDPPTEFFSRVHGPTFDQGDLPDTMYVSLASRLRYYVSFFFLSATK